MNNNNNNNKKKNDKATRTMKNNTKNKRYLMGLVKNIKLTKLHNNRDLHKTTKDYKNSLKTIRMKLENNRVNDIISVLDEITVELDILSYLNTFE